MDKEREALVRVCQGMIDIVERVGCKDWRDQHGRRLKDTKEWVEFYVTVNRAAEQAALTAPQQEPVAWLVQYRDRHEFTFKKPAFLIDAVAEPLYGLDLLDYADRMRTYWQAINHRMVVLHLGTADSFDADTCMNKILEWETQIALDPSVSRQAEELRDTHKERAETAERQLAELQAKHDALVKRLREPTQEMQTAGVDATEFTFSCKRQVRDAFRAMSAVALDKGGE